MPTTQKTYKKKTNLDIDLTAIQTEKFNNELRASICQDSFEDFCKEFWETFESKTLIWSDYLKLITTNLEVAGKILSKGLPPEKLILINCPPGIGKSNIGILFSAWLWTINPSLEILHASSTQDIAKKRTGKIILLVNSEKYKLFFPQVKLREGSQGKLDFKTTENGAIISAGRSTSLLGTHFDAFWIDDPIDYTEINSEVERDSCNNWIDWLRTSRANDTALTVVISQRLATNDSTAYLLETIPLENINHICLPAELNSSVSPATFISHYQRNGGLLDPIRLSLDKLAEKQIGEKDRNYQAQYLQMPTDTVSEQISDSWFNTMHQTAFEEMIKDKQCVYDTWIDSAQTETKRNDPTVMLSIVFFQGKVYVTNMSRKWLVITDLIDHIKSWTARNHHSIRSKIWIEPKSNGIDIINTLSRTTNLKLESIPSPNKESKDDRFTSIIPSLMDRKVVLIERPDDSFHKTFLNEILGRSRHDDVKDVLAYACRHYLNKKTNYGKYVVR